MTNRLSHTQVSTYNACGEKFRLHYRERIRPEAVGSALIFGAALDAGLNALLTYKIDPSDSESYYKRNLRAKTAFTEAMLFPKINGTAVAAQESLLINYSQSDFDPALMPEVAEEFAELLVEKKSGYFYALPAEDKAKFQYWNWLSLIKKGTLMIEAYEQQILPKIKEVICIQKQIDLKNDDGDSVIGFLDLAVVWEDGKRYILDNKTASKPYEPNAAKESEQLALYYHAMQEELKLDGVGFIVMNKAINKNKTKICTECGFDGSKGRHKNCPNEGFNKSKGRCGGEFKETIDPSCDIQIILDTVSSDMEDSVIASFDNANTGIHENKFEKNFDSCFQYGKCPYYDLCHKGDYKGLVKLEKE